MKKRNNTWTIIRKEFARFFGDRQLVFTTVIMPGLLIYLIYSLMGVGIRNMETHGEQDVVTVRVENMPQSVAPLLASLDSSIALVQQPVSQADIDALQDKEINAVLMRFPANFDDLVATSGTGIACGHLVEQAGATIEGFAFLVELGYLNPREAIAEYFNQEVFTLVKYD